MPTLRPDVAYRNFPVVHPLCIDSSDFKGVAINATAANAESLPQRQPGTGSCRDVSSAVLSAHRSGFVCLGSSCGRRDGSHGSSVPATRRYNRTRQGLPVQHQPHKDISVT